MPQSAIALASVPPDVKTTSRGAAPSNRAASSRASSMISRAPRPSACTLDGLPRPPVIAAKAARAASGRTGDVAFQSR